MPAMVNRQNDNMDPLDYNDRNHDNYTTLKLVNKVIQGSAIEVIEIHNGMIICINISHIIILYISFAARISRQISLQSFTLMRLIRITVFTVDHIPLL